MQNANSQPTIQGLLSEAFYHQEIANKIFQQIIDNLAQQLSQTQFALQQLQAKQEKPDKAKK